MKRPVKIDLHCHLDGSLSVEWLQRMLGREVRTEEIQAPPECGSLGEYLTRFDLPLSCLQTREGLRTAAEDFLLHAAQEQTDYVEVRFAPALSCREGLTCGQVMESVLEGMKKAEEQCHVRWNIIVCAMRHHDVQTNRKMLKACREFLGDGLCGADLAGDEAGFPTGDFREVFEYAKRLDYPFTIHAGECGSVQSVLDAVDFGAKRIGHGIALRGHQDAIDLCRRKRIGIEMCPISNYQTKALKPGEVYPLREFLKKGMCATVNTDNRTVSATCLEKEWEFLRTAHGITEEELELSCRNAVDAAFAGDEIKQELWERMQ
ncbi:MAG: adenosine deaminase [Lachnospiraceae bacterium]